MQKAIISALIFFAAIQAESAQAETFKGADFLTWPRHSQQLYIRTSVGMAGLIAAENDKVHANCLEDWYFDDEERSTDFVLETMRRFPEYHPRGVIVAVLEKQCGTFNYTERQ